MAPYARPKFVLFGASMTEYSFCHGGWGAALANLYCRKADIVLRGYRGWNTRRALEVLDNFFPKDAENQPELVVVFFGANDGAFPMPSGRGQHVPLPEFEDNLCRISAHLQGLSDKTRVILTTAPPIYEPARLEAGPNMERREQSIWTAQMSVHVSTLQHAGVQLTEWERELSTSGLQFNDSQTGRRPASRMGCTLVLKGAG
ncbi:GDSL esterase/lipase CPRD49 isoform X4 [Physcomitrium patens]|uniref:GDSL esterase/lipase CPRD49 isoform X4 n=1 Tax=Physcomitrium patens TaxID=3218 RepID=UPI000D162C47|nr:GDSL esterase/lipase CPRD49-like isoform X4 [Physcomitrium patens]|eukprot:XP_024383653.1 GDSL esterase/lipase CPRD49-like isoform X4 [Physcomitrella patens]